MAYAKMNIYTLDVAMPLNIARRLLAFLESGGTGQVALNIHQGKILNAEIKERVTGQDATNGVESTR